ncbi:MAG: GNAT family N-acetyltransferase [Erysipelotrichaceae bacterium]|nr:GNAT family N-acetyltransferase [Erysipelotrichaceae bacterium]
MIRTIRMKSENIDDLVEFSKQDGFPYAVDRNMLKEYCQGADPIKMCVQTYGVYDDDHLISVMTATYQKVFFHPDSPSGNIVHISGAYTVPQRRSQGYGTLLLNLITKEAKEYFKADYICCDTTNVPYFSKNGFVPSNEDRMWKQL